MNTVNKNLLTSRSRYAETSNGIHPVDHVQGLDSVDIEVDDRNRRWPSRGEYIALTFTDWGVTITLDQPRIFTQPSLGSVEFLALTNSWR